MTKTVPQALRDLGELFEERNALYKNNYLHFGDVLLGMFPDGLTLKTAEEFNRFALFLQIVHKQTRYAHSMLNGGHADSCDDTSVYSQMLREFDGLTADQKIKATLEDRDKTYGIMKPEKSIPMHNYSQDPRCIAGICFVCGYDRDRPWHNNRKTVHHYADGRLVDPRL